MTYEGWAQTVPEAITADVLWRMKVYRPGLFASDIGWEDVTKLMQDQRTLRLSDQLYRSLGSISANIAEGYSRSSGKDRARCYEYALGSARESRDGYYKSRHNLTESGVQHRVDRCAQIIRLLLTMLPDQRHRTLKEDPVAYEVDDPA